MVTVRPATAADVLTIEVRGQQDRGPDAQSYVAENFDRLGDAWTFVRETGELLIVCGVMTVWPGRGMAWSMVAEDRPWQDMMEAGGILNQMLENRLKSDYHRIESYADCEPASFYKACDWWLNKLGFHFEGYLEQFTQDGRGQYIYSRTRSDG